MKSPLVFIFVFLTVAAGVGNGKRHHGKPSKKSTIPKAPSHPVSLSLSHHMPWTEISKKSLIAQGVDPTISVQKSKRGFLANLANLLNDAETISGHKTNADVQDLGMSSLTLHPQKTLIDKVSTSDRIQAVEPVPEKTEKAEKKDKIDLSSFKDAVKESGNDYAPIFAMYHGKFVELGKLPESAFKKSHPLQHESQNAPVNNVKDVTASKRYLKDTPKEQGGHIEITPIRRELHSVTTIGGGNEQLKSYLKNLDLGEQQQQQQTTSVTKDIISAPSLDGLSSKSELLNHVKGVVLDDGKVISVGASHLLENSDTPKPTQEVVADTQQKFVVNNEGNVEPLIKQRPESADAVTRDTLDNANNGQKTVTLTVDVLKDLLKKTDSKVSLAQLLNKPSASEQRSNTQEDEDPGTIEDFAAGGLKAHNEYRGKHHDDNVIWSDDLAAKAQKLAEALADRKTLEIAKDLEKEGMGENVAKVWATFKNAGEAATKMWYSQSENYRFDDPHLDENTGQFAQVVWKSTKELGMGVAKSIDDVNNKYVYVTALYHPPGNIEAVLRDNVMPTGNNTQDVYSTFFKRTGVIDVHHASIERRSKMPKIKKQKTKNLKVLGNTGD